MEKTISCIIDIYKHYRIIVRIRIDFAIVASDDKKANNERIES